MFEENKKRASTGRTPEEEGGRKNEKKKREFQGEFPSRKLQRRRKKKVNRSTRTIFIQISPRSDRALSVCNLPKYHIFFLFPRFFFQSLNSFVACKISKLLMLILVS